MVDLYGYAMIMPDGTRKLVFRSSDGSIDAKSRFKYMPAEIDLSYEALVEAVNSAIDKEAAEHDGKFVTDERITEIEAPEYDYGELMARFQELAGKLMNENPQNGVKITAIIDKYLGKGKKIGEATPAQVEMIYLIVTEIEDTLIKPE